ncbi:MAG: hypothetical protein OEY01_03465 [Desulfobulbaceae bacterium]|nr:hypothetical protein [Desulfobulbaceae bacterium]
MTTKKKPTPEQKEIINGLQKHALAHYEEGWDMLYEAWEDYEIVEVLEEKDIMTFEEALEEFTKIMGICGERRAEVQSFIF